MGRKDRKAPQTQTATEPETQTAVLPEPTPAPEPTKPEPKSKRLSEAEIRTKHEHVIAGTLVFETEGKHAGKQTIEAKLPCCGAIVRLATSDLWQVRACPACAKTAGRERRKAKRHAKAEARKIAKAQQTATATIA